MGTSSTVLLPYSPASVAIARQRLTEDLRDAGIGEGAVGDAAIVISELLSNSLRHARPLPGGQVRIGWSVEDGMIELAVSDGGATTRPRASWPSLSSIGGRGLSIVRHLTWRWGVRADASETTVWALVPAPAGGRGAGGVPEYRPGDANGDVPGAHPGGGSGAGRETRTRHGPPGRPARHG